jgi:hypothetical protein
MRQLRVGGIVLTDDVADIFKHTGHVMSTLSLFFISFLSEIDCEALSMSRTQ